MFIELFIDRACMCILSFKVYGILHHAHFIHEGKQGTEELGYLPKVTAGKR